MNNSIPYERIFDLMEAKRLIIFEDDFTKLEDKNAILYGMARMNAADQDKVLKYAEKTDKMAFDQLSKFIRSFNSSIGPSISSWEEQIIENDIITSFTLASKEESANIIKIYDEIDIAKWPKRPEMMNILHRYAVGVEVSEAYATIFNEYVEKNGRRKPMSIYCDFSSDTSECFLREIEAQNDGVGTTVCVIDDMLQSELRAEEIVKCIQSKFDSERANVVGMIFSSKQSTDSISKDVYFERISKAAEETKMKAALARSAYSFLLYKLSKTYKAALGDAFESAVKSKSIAFYLSNMATAEGCTSYQVITDWINQIYRFKLNKSDELVSVAKLTRLISLLEDETVKFDSDTLEMNSFEAFDYNVNYYREPVAPGDIFMTTDKKIFIMVGQACDSMFRNAKDGCKNGVIELVSAELKSQENTDISVRMKSDYIWISNYKRILGTNVEYKALKVKYTSKGLIDNQILQLCQFNDDGECKICLSKKEYAEKGVEPEYYGELYSRLLHYFDALKKLKTANIELFSIVVENELSKRLFCAGNWQENGDVISYGIRRIGRLRHPYILYINKMYLEYQGRHPFDCINMTRVHRIEVPVEGTAETLPINVILSTERDTNMSRIDLLPWVIDKLDLIDFVYRRDGKKITLDLENDNIIVDKDTKEISQISQDDLDTKIILSKDKFGKLSVTLVKSDQGLCQS